MKKLLITYDENTADGGDPINMFDYLMNEFENSDIEATLLEPSEIPTVPTMAERWVTLFNEWQDSDLTSTYDFCDWLDKAHPGERETLTWIANWDSRPVDGQLKADPRRATSFAVMDFGDGSIAIKRQFNYEDNPQWMVAS